MNDINDAYLLLLRAEQQIGDRSGLVLGIVDLVRSPGAIDHLRHGLCRRLLLLKRGASLICQITPPEREEPLSDDEGADLNLHLNSVYLHIRGATDNLAWALALEHNVLGEARENHPAFQRRVGLFGKAFQAGLARVDAEFAAALSARLTALAELPQLRDPVAHRIPLYVVPAVLSEEQARQHTELSERWNRAISERALDQAEATMRAMGEMGKFRPVFAHSMREPVSAYPLHRRLGSDLDALSSIIDVCVQFLRKEAV